MSTGLEVLKDIQDIKDLVKGTILNKILVKRLDGSIIEIYGYWRYKDEYPTFVVNGKHVKISTARLAIAQHSKEETYALLEELLLEI